MSFNRSAQRIAAYAVIVRDGRILLCRLGGQGCHAGHWTLPGGGIEFGEHPAEAVVREVKEETGLEVCLGDLVAVDSQVFPTPRGRMHAVRFVYRAVAERGRLVPERRGSTNGCAWLTLPEILEMPRVELVNLGLSIAFPDRV